MIPRRIMYCWFGGGEMPERDRRCLKSWSEMCPQYEIVRIDESVYDVSSDPFARESYERGNWSFVSDAARMWALSQEGGFYLDTDIELLAPLDRYGGRNALICEAGRGFYSTHLLARDEWPAIYEDARSGLSLESDALPQMLNELVYERYDVCGGDEIELEDVTLLGVNIVSNGAAPAGPRTVAVHHCNNSWSESWCNGVDMSIERTLHPLDIWRGGDRLDMSGVYGSRRPVGIMVLAEDVEPTLDVLELSNYLFNDRVISVRSGDGSAMVERYGATGTSETRVLEDGTRIELKSKGGSVCTE